MPKVTSLTPEEKILKGEAIAAVADIGAAAADTQFGQITMLCLDVFLKKKNLKKKANQHIRLLKMQNGKEDCFSVLCTHNSKKIKTHV